MSLTLARLGRPTGLGPALQYLRHAAAARLRRMAQGAALRRQMERMDPHIMADLGISHAQLHFEIEEWVRGRH
jgi:uncharacterized protein YjiS (DUF1127 family)